MGNQYVPKRLPWDGPSWFSTTRDQTRITPNQSFFTQSLCYESRCRYDASQRVAEHGAPIYQVGAVHYFWRPMTFNWFLSSLISQVQLLFTWHVARLKFTCKGHPCTKKYGLPLCAVTSHIFPNSFVNTASSSLLSLNPFYHRSFDLHADFLTPPSSTSEEIYHCSSKIPLLLFPTFPV